MMLLINCDDEFNCLQPVKINKSIKNHKQKYSSLCLISVIFFEALCLPKKSSSRQKPYCIKINDLRFESILRLFKQA